MTGARDSLISHIISVDLFDQVAYCRIKRRIIVIAIDDRSDVSEVGDSSAGVEWLHPSWLEDDIIYPHQCGDIRKCLSIAQTDDILAGKKR